MSSKKIEWQHDIETIIPNIAILCKDYIFINIPATLRQCLRIYPDDNFNSPDTMDRFDSLKYIDWVPNRYLQQCMDFICSGSPTMTTIIGEFDTPELTTLSLPIIQ